MSLFDRVVLSEGAGSRSRKRVRRAAGRKQSELSRDELPYVKHLEKLGFRVELEGDPATMSREQADIAIIDQASGKHVGYLKGRRISAHVSDPKIKRRLAIAGQRLK